MTINVFDFFAGCGGTSCGFRNAGLNLKYALDHDIDSKSTYLHNLGDEIEYEHRDIRDVVNSLGGEDCLLTTIIDELRQVDDNLILFCGCAPCQPFTKQNTTDYEDDPRRNLLHEFLTTVSHFLPDLIFVENVPGIQSLETNNDLFETFITTLENQGYFVSYQIVTAQNYGVPQKRRRLIVIASRLGPITFPPITHGPGAENPEFSRVIDWIAQLPPIAAGETHPEDQMHRSARLSDLNLARIQAISEGEGRMNWPENLRLTCHSNGYTGHTDVYGRMFWNKPATGLTTRCISLSNGRFGHPEQDRAISIREAALLQTFPPNYHFSGSLNSMARQIGNAVPVLLAHRFGEQFLLHEAQVLQEEQVAG